MISWRLDEVRSVVGGMILAGICCGCDLGISQAPAPASCTAIGAQCQRPEGPIGVCQEAPCDPGAKPPCFKCTSQH